MNDESVSINTIDSLCQIFKCPITDIVVILPDTLVVYFSRWGNTEYASDVDATASASIVVDNDLRYGTTEYVANMIAEKVDGDLHRIETVTPYTADFDELRDVNHDEMNRNYLPKLKKSDLDISAYDTVFVGYPVWAMDVPQTVLSFLNEYDLTGKTVIPFCTHAGYGAGNSYQTIAEASHAVVPLEGIAIEAKDVPNAQDAVSSWLADIGIQLQQSLLVGSRQRFTPERMKQP